MMITQMIGISQLQFDYILLDLRSAMNSIILAFILIGNKREEVINSFVHGLEYASLTEYKR